MRFIILLVAAVIAVVAGVFALQFSGDKGAPPPQPQAQTQPDAAPAAAVQVTTTNVWVARDVIPVGTVITEAMVEQQPWPSHLVVDGFATGESSAVVGKIARVPFQSREPLLTSKLGGANEPGFLAAVLPAGMRAITIATDAISGVAGYVFPGDRVDLIMTHNIPKMLHDDGSIRSDRPQVTEVLIPGARVLAVNVRPSPNQPSTQQLVTSPSSVTIEVSETDAQRVRLAEKLGSLSLSLRSLTDSQAKMDADPTVPSMLTRSAGDVRTGDSVRVVRGAGGDLGPTNQNSLFNMQPTMPSGTTMEAPPRISEEVPVN